MTITEIKKRILDERTNAMASKRAVDKTFNFSLSDDKSGAFTFTNSFTHDGEATREDKYTKYSNVTIFEEGAVMTINGEVDYVVSKGSLENAVSKITSDVIVNANHVRYESDYSSGYIGHIDVDSLKLVNSGVDDRLALVGDLMLLSNHSKVVDFEAQALPLSVSSELIVNDYKFTNVNGQEDIFILVDYDITGLAVVSYPRSASSVDTLKPVKENTMAKKKLENQEQLADESTTVDTADLSNNDVVDKVVVEGTETAPEGVETADTIETSSTEEKHSTIDVNNSVTVAVKNAIEELKTVRLELNNAVERADKAESLNNELKAQIAEIENSVKTLIGNATQEKREATIENKFNVLNTKVEDYK